MKKCAIDQSQGPSENICKNLIHINVNRQSYRSTKHCNEDVRFKYTWEYQLDYEDVMNEGLQWNCMVFKLNLSKLCREKA